MNSHNKHQQLVDSLVADDGGLDTSNPANYKALKTKSLTWDTQKIRLWGTYVNGLGHWELG